MHTFGVPNGNPFCELSREFRVVVSAATGTERVLVPGAEIVLEMVRMAVIEQCPSLMPTLYPGVMAAEPRPFGTLDAMWLAFQALANTKTPATNGDVLFPLPASSSGVRSFTPSRPRPDGNGRGQGRTPSQSPAWQMGSRNNPTVINVNKSIPDCTDPWLSTFHLLAPRRAPQCRSLSCLLIHPDRRSSSVERPTYTNGQRCHPPRKPGSLPELPRSDALTQTV